MRRLVLVVSLLIAGPATAQPAGSGSAAPTAGSAAPAAGSAAPAAGSAAPADQPPVAQPPVAQPPAPPPTPAEPALCRLAEPPPPLKPGEKSPPSQHSPMRQVCEDELAKDHDWWWNLVGRLRVSEHGQAARSITTNNRHVVAAYAAIWLLTVGFVLLMWQRQQRLKGEIARLEEQLRRVEAEDAKRAGKGGGS